VLDDGTVKWFTMVYCVFFAKNICQPVLLPTQWIGISSDTLCFCLLLLSPVKPKRKVCGNCLFECVVQLTNGMLIINILPALF